MFTRAVSPECGFSVVDLMASNLSQILAAHSLAGLRHRVGRCYVCTRVQMLLSHAYWVRWQQFGATMAALWAEISPAQGRS